MKLVIVIGVRPNFVKIAPLLRELREDFEIVLVHSGQHYDFNMSEVFFNQLGLPKSSYNLEVGSFLPPIQISHVMERFTSILLDEKPNMVLTIGDNNSSLGATLSAVKMNIPVGHVEAGLRSFDNNQTEEINRLLIDRVSKVCFCPTNKTRDNILKDNVGVDGFFSGDLLLDAFYMYTEEVERSEVLSSHGVRGCEYALLTIHRPENTEVEGNLCKLLELVCSLNSPIIFPIHPRTRRSLLAFNLWDRFSKIPKMKIIDPLGYLDFSMLTRNARLVITDSNGLQREAYFSRRPTLVLRIASEFTEGIAEDVLRISPLSKDLDELIRQVNVLNSSKLIFYPELFGDGKAAFKIKHYLTNILHV